MEKENTYRALPSSRGLVADETSPLNKSLHAKWRNRMCDLCFQRATMIVKGRLYCKDHAPKE